MSPRKSVDTAPLDDADVVVTSTGIRRKTDADRVMEGVAAQIQASLQSYRNTMKFI